MHKRLLFSSFAATALFLPLAAQADVLSILNNQHKSVRELRQQQLSRPAPPATSKAVVKEEKPVVLAQAKPAAAAPEEKKELKKVKKAKKKRRKVVLELGE